MKVGNHTNINASTQICMYIGGAWLGCRLDISMTGVQFYSMYCFFLTPCVKVSEENFQFQDRISPAPMSRYPAIQNRKNPFWGPQKYVII